MGFVLDLDRNCFIDPQLAQRGRNDVFSTHEDEGYPENMDRDQHDGRLTIVILLVLGVVDESEQAVSVCQTATLKETHQG